VIAGLLVVIVFLLIYIAGRVGRLAETLGGRDRSQPDGGATGSDTPLTVPAEERAEPASGFQAADDVSAVDEPTAEPVVTEPEPEPIGASGVAVETAATQEPEPQASAPAISEQPFEKDGRWWFRRDGELLVYDEQRGEWQPAPEEEPDEPWSGQSVAAESAPTSTWATEPAQTETAEQPVTSAWDSPATSAPEPTETAAPVQSADVTHPLDEPRPGEPGYDGPDVEQPAQMSHWKCPSCGVINGSTATSCRMCFAARP
jgi:hypothetical protein